MDIAGSHVGFQVMKKREMFWAKRGKDGRFLEEGTVGKVIEIEIASHFFIMIA